MIITYASAFAHLKRWFMSRGGDLLANDQAIFDYLNLTIQDIYNEDNATFLYIYEELSGVVNGKKNKFTTTFDIRKIQKIYEVDAHGNTTRELMPTLLPTNCSQDVMFKGNEILTDSNINKIYVIYIKEYVWAKYPEDLVKEVPLPKRYIPTMYKLTYDWAAPINLMQDEAQSTDFYSHGITRLNKLAAEDGVTDYLQVKPAY